MSPRPANILERRPYPTLGNGEVPPIPRAGVTAPRAPEHAELPRLALWPPALLGITLVALHLGFGLFGEYGLFIDELYYLACAERLDWGYVDHPPLAPAVLWLARRLFGEGDWVLRLLPALAGAATVLLTALLARRLGGGPFAQGLAALAVALAPMILIISGFFSMNSFEILLWTLAAYLLVLVEQHDEPRLWWFFGLVAGIGLLNKHTMVLFASGLGVGLLASGGRRHLLARHLWIALAISALVFLPNVLWQAAHGWPSLDFYAGAAGKNVPTPAFEVLALQVLVMNPFNLLIWGTGLVALLCSRRFRSLRHLGWIAASLLGLAMLAGQSRPDRIAGIYPMLFAAGAVVLAGWATRPRRRWLRFALPAGVLVSGAVLAPLGVPVLPPAQMSRYVATLGVVPQIEAGEGKTGELPQWYADRFGWEQLADEVDTIIAGLGPAERDQVVVFAPSYGQAGALERYGTSGASVYSTHNNYFLWGPPEGPITVAVVIGNRAERLEELFDEVELARIHDCSFCIRWRDEMPIWIVRHPRRPIAELWPEIRSFG